MKNLIPLVWLVACFFLLPGCNRDPGAENAPQVDAPTVLRRGNGGDPRSLDPALATDTHAFNVLRDLYEGLVVETKDGKLVGGVASRWDRSADGRLYTFYIREDAAWSDGGPVTASDFVRSFRRALAPASASPYAFLLYPVVNARAVTAGELAPGELGVRAIGPRTLEIELTAPMPYFPGILAMPVAFPVRETAAAGEFSNPDSFIGNGPYLLEEWQPGFRLRLARNPFFRDADEVAIDIVEYYPVEDADTEFNMYRAGELHITATVPPRRMAQVRAERPSELHIAPSLGLYYVALDVGEPPFDDVSLRRSLTLATDREALVDILGRGEAAAYGIVPDGVNGYEPARYDWAGEGAGTRLERARAAYAAAGYGPDNVLRFTLLYDAGDIHETVALAVQAMWQDALGADITLEKREWQYFLDTRNDRSSWQAMRFAWTGDYNDASTFLDIFRSDSPQNLAGFTDPGYDSLLDRAGVTVDMTARAGVLKEAESRLLEAAPVVPLYFYVSKHLVSPRVRNYEPNVLDVHHSRYIELAGDQP